ncbi:Alpha/Beta hydrolase protein [Catenaria anguillulae PL171]|uniref:Alpha/Beta hydrolase protein n=1 Tax=Catenaria anguillulae PL171 TaxID=765915 RepID=A0A1Y2HBY9_9FUNG|nr:Alpha/Beta hydrolase protein [Catenaria anguillulae PL171]
MQLACGPKCQLPQVRESQMIRVIEQDSNLVVIVDRPDKNEMIASFRGSANVANMLDNLELDRIPWPFNQPAAANLSSPGTFTVHKGFTDAYRTVRDDMLTTVQQHLARNPDRTLLVSGHSLGGAIAAMAALDIVAGRMIDAARVDLVTYGTPRIGDRAFASLMEGVGFRMMQRVVSGRDLIPHVPAQAIGYQQLDGELFVRSTSTRKAGGAKVSACRGKEDPACSNSRVPFLSLVAHGQFLSGASFFGQGGCRTDTAD